MSKEINALVTGGARGIGLAIASELSASGANVVICSRTRSEVEKSETELSLPGRKVKGVVANVSDSIECQHLFEKALNFLGTLNVLVNNAGIYGPIGRLETVSPLAWEETIRVNLLSMVFCTQLAIPVMKSLGKGKIINLCGGGVGGQSTLPNFSAYYTSKVAVAGFTEVMAAELSDSNIQVNAVSPGAVNSQLTDYLLSHNESSVGHDMYARAIRQKQSGGDSPLLAAKLVAFLASDKSNHITGRLLSAKWDPIESLASEAGLKPNAYKLRRYGND